MSGDFQLGAAGEEAYRRLRNICELAPGFEPCLLRSEHRQALAELRRRLEEEVGGIERWEPDGDLLERARTLARALESGSRPPIVWLEAKPFDAEAWQRAFAALNWKRERLAEEAPWVWVLAGPPELAELFASQAPDLLSGVSVRLELPAAAESRFQVEPFRWLHLSDFHFEATERWDRRATLRALLRHCEQRVEEGRGPGAVFLTGDVASSGRRREYEQAERFFHEVAGVLGLEPARHFFVVPGNHDVDRSRVGFGDEAVLDSLGDQGAIEQLFDDKQALALVGRRLEAFYAFTEGLLGTARAWYADKPFRTDEILLGGVPVGVLQLSSAWASGPKDGERGLLVGEAQLRAALEETAAARLRVALVHHPAADLREFDQATVSGLLGAPGGAHFLLRGHRHEGESVGRTTPDGQLLELAAGAAYAEGRWPRGFLETEVDLAAGEARVEFFAYSAKGRGFWAKDTRVYERASDGVATFALPEELRLAEAAPAAPAAAPLSEAQREGLTERYRRAAAAVHGTVRFLGFADHRPRPNVRVPELFVPLRLSQERAGKEAKVWSTRELLESLLQPAQGRWQRGWWAVVLGDPGSGKTTLCRYAAVALAGEAGLEGLAVPEALLPLFLPFREYVRQCRERADKSLLAFLEEQARDHLQLGLPEGFLAAKLESGDAVLLLDGLDEVGSAGEREEMRERLMAFVRLYPKVAILVTSRVAGYDDAPLPRGDQPYSFAHLRLDAFDADDLRTFVRHWYAVQEPDDPLERDRGRAELLAALEADPRVRDLARSPMLATLIALVHRYEAHLPGERAKLYELCVKTLLETWPAAKRRAFREIDEGLQRAYLEALAYRMQRNRVINERDVVIERFFLIETLTAIVVERGDSGLAPEAVERMVERWVRYLEQGTGLLVEQRPGVYTFSHLSLMEFLAAEGMDRAEVLEETIAVRYSQPTWRETCLLAVGIHATDKAFLDRLWKCFAKVNRNDRWSFFLSCLREEAAFAGSQREEIVRQAGLALVAGRWFERRDDEQTLDEISRFSRRHGEWLRKWVRQELVNASGEALRAIVLLHASQLEWVIEFLGRRKDVSRRAADLLEYWPEPKVGRWAVAQALAGLAFDWVVAAPAELRKIRSIVALAIDDDASKMMSGLIAGLAHGAADAAWLSNRGREGIARVGGWGNEGLPEVVIVDPGRLLLQTAVRWPVELRSRNLQIERYFARDFSRHWVRGSSSGFSLYFSRPFIRDVVARARDQNILSTQDSEINKTLLGRFIREPVQAFGANFALLFYKYFSRDFYSFLGAGLVGQATVSFPQELAAEFARAFALEPMSGARLRKEFPAPSWERFNGFSHSLLPRVRGEQNLDSAKAWLVQVVAQQAGESWVGFVSTAGDKPEEFVTYAHHRMANAWLLQMWPDIDHSLGPDPSPDRLALYLALGWTQSTTTWQWPPTERWVDLLGGRPPAHWMPRSQWHLCWLLHDPGDAEHRRALDAALEEGLADPERPKLAATLRELFPPSAEGG